MSGFQHDIAGGNGNLVVTSLKSPDYVPGVSGWAVFKNGNAEFNSGTFRGHIVGGDLFIYSGTPALGNPPIGWISGGTSDPFGNTLQSTSGIAGTGTFQAGNEITTTHGRVAYTGATPAPNTLAYSDAVTAFTDSSGNQILPGRTIYNKIDPFPTYQALNFTVAPGNGAQLQSFKTLSNESGAWSAGAGIQLLASGTTNIIGGPLVSTAGTPGAPSQISTDTWNAVSLTGAPAGTTGTARVKLLPLQNMAVLDIEIAFTALGAQASFTIGSLPSASYYPTVTRHYPVGAGGTETGTPQPRVFMPTSGGVQLVDLPAGMSALGITQVYPLD